MIDGEVSTFTLVLLYENTGSSHFYLFYVTAAKLLVQFGREMLYSGFTAFVFVKFLCSTFYNDLANRRLIRYK